jgi:hypothetical protein
MRIRPQAAIDNLTNYQEQCDMDGVMVQVSRQALCEILEYLKTVDAGMLEKLDQLHRDGTFFGFSIWPTNTSGELQISLATTSKTNWRIRRSDTPSGGLALVLGMGDLDDNGVSDPDREPEMRALTLADYAYIAAEKREEPGIFD